MDANAAEPDLRVILVGRTGLDGALRLDPGIEVVRARTALEAIGEVSQPLGEPQACVVVVGAEVEASLGAGSRMAEFVRGLKTADPGVRVLRVSQNGATAGSELFDASIAPGSKSQDVRALVRERSRPTVSPGHTGDRAPGVEPDGSVDAMFTARPAKAPDPAADAGDRATGDLVLLSLVLKGQDPAPAAVALIRERTGDATVDFIPAGAAPASGGTPVAWEQTVFGHLVSRAGAGAAQQARWLAGWLRLRDQQSQLRHAAFTDALTGAWNRRYFDRFLARAIDEAREKRQHVTVLVFDIDDFKRYNDRYGHEAGDDILRETVHLLRSVIRPQDRVCRIGGDEFAVVFFEPQGPRQEGSRHPSSVFDIAQRFQQQINSHRFPKLADLAPGTLTISGGLATFPWDGATPEQLLSRADQLALASKRQGKNAITFGPGAIRGGV